MVNAPLQGARYALLMATGRRPRRPAAAMEERMWPAMERTSAEAVSRSRHVLARLRAWLRPSGELGAMSPNEIGRIAEDVGMTASELKDLAARGQHAADQLRERMQALGIGKADVERVAPGLMRDLERTCTCCSEKGCCQADLPARPD